MLGRAIAVRDRGDSTWSVPRTTARPSTSGRQLGHHFAGASRAADPWAGPSGSQAPQTARWRGRAQRCRPPRLCRRCSQYIGRDSRLMRAAASANSSLRLPHFTAPVGQTRASRPSLPPWTSADAELALADQRRRRFPLVAGDIKRAGGHAVAAADALARHHRPPRRWRPSAARRPDTPRRRPAPGSACTGA